MLTPRSLATFFVMIVLGCTSATGCVGAIDDGSSIAPEGSSDPGGAVAHPGELGLGAPTSPSDSPLDAGAPDGAPVGEHDSAPSADSGAPPPPVDAGAKPDEGSAPDTHVDPPADAGPASSRQVQRPLGSSDAPNGYYEYLPPGYSTSGVGSPLLLFWHGLGEDGNGTSELNKVLVNGPPKLIAADAWPSTRPFVVLSPQNASGCPSGASIKAFLGWALAHYHVDPARIYLSGLSCGAIGSWSYLQSEVSTTPIAAAVLIAGDGHGAWDTNSCGLGRVAIWAFHGDADGTVSPTGTTYPMTNLLACPSPPRRDAQMTIYPGCGHDSWSRTYDGSAGHDVFQWMLDNHL